MLNVDKLMKRNRLIRELIDKGIAKNFEEAAKMVDKNKMLAKNFEDNISFLINENNKKADNNNNNNNNQKLNTTDNSNHIKKADNNQIYEKKFNDLSNKIDKIDSVLSRLIEYFENYQKVTDQNLKEIDYRLKELEILKKEKDTKPNKIEIKKEKNNNNKAKEDNPYSIDKIFNNSHGRLVKK